MGMSGFIFLFLSTLSLRRATKRIRHRREKPRHFYPRSPCGERPPKTLRHCTTYLFLSTLSLRRATNARPDIRPLDVISIHALLAESDPASHLSKFDTSQNFYPRSPCGERPIKFKLNLINQDFYPRSPCGERLTVAAHVGRRKLISIHALLAESDYTHPIGVLVTVIFLSTLSLRRATEGAAVGY